MLRIGFVGLGKLGLPVALALNSYKFDVCGTDIDPNVKGYLENKQIPYKEELANDLLNHHTIKYFDTIDDVIRNSDVIFMPVQTPHDKRYEGITRLPPERKDFDYTYLIKAVTDFTKALQVSSDPSLKTLVIISTVLPGTIRKHILPIVKQEPRIVLIYNPFFIAMGTVIHDFLNPEFILLGMEDKSQIPGHLIQIYNTIYRAPNYQPMSIESAELTKCCYNTFITTKICMVNTIGELCHKIPGANVDDITNALKDAKDRLISTKYLTAGLGDGGGCHPRDNIAMSWLAKKVDLSYDWFENLMLSRERQADFLFKIIFENYKEGDSVIVLGYEFKPETDLTVGSHALLVAEILREYDIDYKLVSRKQAIVNNEAYNVVKKVDYTNTGNKLIFFIGCKHEEFEDFVFPVGSVVVDPFRYIPNQTGVKIIRVGE